MSDTTEAESSHLPPAIAGPLDPSARFASMDVLRGVAVLGILAVNIQSYAMINAAYINPLAYGDLTGANYGVWWVSRVFVDRVFLEVFSLLFGAGIVLMAEHREAGGRPVAALHYRRMAVLMLFGLMHAYLLWYGDILWSLGLCGMIVYIFRRRKTPTLLILGTLSVCMLPVLTAFYQFAISTGPPDAVQELRDSFMPPPSSVAEELATYRGTWLQQTSKRVPTAMFFQTVVFLYEPLWRVGGLMYLGMALSRLGFFRAQWASRTYALLFVLGLAVGVPIQIVGVRQNFAHGWDATYSIATGIQYFHWGSLFIVLAWVTGVMLLVKHNPLPGLASRLADCGRMSLTNYLAQTAICTTIFYGHGFGLYGKLERTEQILLVLAIWIAQLLCSPLWLRHFQFGPVEWLWRTLSYMKAQPMRRGPTVFPTTQDA